MTCSSCTHYSAKAAADTTIEPVKQDTGAIGVCRRYPPRLLPQPGQPNLLASRFPHVHRANLCGEYLSSIPL